MKLRHIHEGWSIDLGDMSLQDVQNALKDKPAARTLIGNGARFRDDDYINDLIRVVPFNKAERLNAVDNTVASRQTGGRADRSHHIFRSGGGKIYYGFTFATTSDGYRDRNIGIASDLAREITYLKHHHDWLDSAINDPQAIAALRTGKVENPISGMPYRLISSDRQKQYAALSGWREEIEAHLAGLKERWLAERDGILPKKGSKTLTQPDDAAKYVHSLKYAFADALKHPSTPKGEQARDTFIAQAAANFAKQHRGEYDIVTFPESSSEFNLLLSRALAGNTGAQIVQGFEKKLVKDVGVDDEALSARYDVGDDGDPVDQEWQRLQNRLNPDNMEKGDLPDPELRRTETDREREARKLRSGLAAQTPKGKTRDTKKIEIKRVAAGDKRRYLDFLDQSPDLDFRGKRVLVVDDNVAHSGTMERIFVLAQKQQPAVLDLYTPLYMGKS